MMNQISVTGLLIIVYFFWKRQWFWTRGISVSLPLSYFPAHSYATIRHQLDVYFESLQHINLNQALVIAYDQPLYKIAKELQWLMPDEYGEGKLAVMMGALHVKMAMNSVIREVLSVSRWEQELTDAAVFTAGRCDALEKGNVNRSQYTYVVTIVALEELKWLAICTSRVR
ncbi:hypothetical protein QYM36_014184 [Artemia franciscana]|uniref:Uncharacterized protein n=1 Tax=Artemia franciscana TaxID=6661 RepID=A0AA88HJ42_ARTSF|nr:hypothetical protein QYM36_014184 [Artemia franciscana]